MKTHQTQDGCKKIERKERQVPRFFFKHQNHPPFSAPGWYPFVPPTWQSSHHWLQTLHRARAAVQIGAPKHPKHHRRWGQNLQHKTDSKFVSQVCGPKMVSGWHQGGLPNVFICWLVVCLFVCLLVCLLACLFVSARAFLKQLVQGWKCKKKAFWSLSISTFHCSDNHLGCQFKKWSKLFNWFEMVRKSQNMFPKRSLNLMMTYHDVESTKKINKFKPNSMGASFWLVSALRCPAATSSMGETIPFQLSASPRSSLLVIDGYSPTC